MQTINPNTNLNEVNHHEYPVIIQYPLQDVTPNNPNALYKQEEIEDDDNEDFPYYTQFEVPTRDAFYQLIADTCQAIQEDIHKLHNCTGDFAPCDDGTEYIREAIYFLEMLREYDFI